MKDSSGGDVRLPERRKESALSHCGFDMPPVHDSFVSMEPGTVASAHSFVATLGQDAGRPKP